MTPIGRELAILVFRRPVPMSVSSLRGRAEPSLRQVRVYDKEGSSRRLLLIIGHIHHIMVEKRREVRVEAGMEVQYHLIPLGSDRGR